MSKELATLKSYSLTKPGEVTQMANAIKQYVVTNNLSVQIQGKAYCMADGWQFAGFLTGVFPIVESVQNLSNANEVKWQANVALMKGDKKVGYGIATCSSKEAKKKGFDEYAILSMAQTRAIGKAFRNYMGWIMKLAGYETAPAEEIKDMGGKKDMFAEAEKMIASSKTQKNLLTIKERIEKSKHFSEEQKQILDRQISNAIDVLEAQNEKNKGKK